MEHIYDTIIIGGGPAGLSAGVYAGRAKLDTLIIEKGSAGGQAATTSEIANYPGIVDITGPKLIEEMQRQVEKFGVSFISGDVKKLNLEGDIKTIELSDKEFQARSVIIATGAKPRKLGFKGEAEFTGRGVGYCATCDGEFFTDLEVFVIGAGYAAVEEAMFLSKFARKVTIIAREPEFTCAKTISDMLVEYNNIESIFNSEIVEASGDGMIEEATFINNLTGEKWTHKASEEDGTFGIFVFVGYIPTTDLFKGHVELDDFGYIPTDNDMKTNISGVYAAGDLRPKSLRQVVTAVADGAIAATTAEKYVTDLKRKLGIKEDNSPKPSKVTEGVEETKKAHGEVLDSQIKEQLSGIFTKLERDITLVNVVDMEDSKSSEISSFLDEISKLSDKINVQYVSKGSDIDFEKKVKADKFPVISFLDENKNYTGIKFHGFPGGHELNSFVLAIYNIAGPGQGVDDTTLNKIKSIDKPINIKVAVSLSCHLCPDVVASAQRIATLNSNVEAEMIEISSFKDIKKDYKIMSVPAIIIDDKEVHFGAKSLESIVDLL